MNIIINNNVCIHRNICLKLWISVDILNSENNVTRKFIVFFKITFHMLFLCDVNTCIGIYEYSYDGYLLKPFKCLRYLIRGTFSERRSGCRTELFNFYDHMIWYLIAAFSI